MQLIIDKGLKGPDAVRAHPLFGKAVFIECGLHEPANFCYDHHALPDPEHVLSSCGMIHRELVQRREFLRTVVMNHIRHLDNLVSVYLLWYRNIALHSDTFILVSVADLVDCVGPIADMAVPQLQYSVLISAQSIIPFKEWELSNEELQELAIKAIENLKAMVTLAQKTARYTSIWESSDNQFMILTSEDPIGNTLYEQGYKAYAVYTTNSNGTYKWTLCRASEYVPFDIPQALVSLNALEPGWGGKPKIAGSPPGAGTKLEPEVIIDILKQHYRP